MTARTEWPTVGNADEDDALALVQRTLHALDELRRRDAYSAARISDAIVDHLAAAARTLTEAAQ